MKEISVKVKFAEGLHARPVVKLMKAAKPFLSEITLEKNGRQVPVDSISAILGACIVCGDEIKVRADGADEEQAIAAMSEFFA